MAALIIYLGNVRAGRRLHATFLRNIISSPMAFFDTTPTGRILNRFGKDVDTIDQVLAGNIHAFSQCVLRVMTVPVVIAYSTPLFLVVVIPLGIVYVVVQVSFPQHMLLDHVVVYSNNVILRSRGYSRDDDNQ